MLNKIKSALYILINHYWKDLTKSDILIASLLDPRMKDLSFVSPEKYDDTKNLLHEKYNEIQNSTSQPIQLTTKKKKHTILASLKKPFIKSRDEIAENLQLEEIDLESDLLICGSVRKE